MPLFRTREFVLRGPTETLPKSKLFAPIVRFPCVFDPAELDRDDPVPPPHPIHGAVARIIGPSRYPLALSCKAQGAKRARA